MGEIKTVHLVHNENAHNWILGDNHPTQGRRFKHAEDALQVLLSNLEDGIHLIPSRAATVEELQRVHSTEYINRVINDHISGEWTGVRPDLAVLASEFAGSTLVALEALLNGAKFAINFTGAKHHAQYDQSSGFCVFADFALAAKILVEDYGKRVAILDIDAHHGDGTENLTKDNPDILTFSVHENGIFPGTGTEHQADESVHNRPLPANSDDTDLIVAVQDFIDTAKAFNPDFIFIAAGGDGHEADPLASLQFTEAGYAHAGELIRTNFPNHPILLGGAGGYRPDDYTPAMWVSIALALAGMSENEIEQLGVLNVVRMMGGADAAE